MENKMRDKKLKSLSRFMLLTATLLMIGSLASAQETRRQVPGALNTNMGKGMGMITPGLLEVGMQTNFFLTIGDQIKMSDEQRSQITEIAYQFQKFANERKGDIGVAEAELQRMVSRDQIDLSQVKEKLSGVHALDADIEFKGIEALIKAIKVLSHEQHILIMTSATNPVTVKPKWQSQ